MSSSGKKEPIVPKGMIFTFVLVTILFPLWGFANDITNPMVAAFKNILLIDNFQSSLVQAAFYGGYALMAIPAALFIKKFSYKKGVVLGLALYSFACLMFIPSGMAMSYPLFLLSYLIMTSGLSFLETTANPYILSMGEEATATRRLNLAQAFNPMGSITGMFVASMFILASLNGTSEAARRNMEALAKQGTAIHLQEVTTQLTAVSNLTEVVSTEGWVDSKKLVKKAGELAGGIQNGIFVLDNKNGEQADQVLSDIVAQPSVNKFKAAADAVAVVLQIKPKPAPTEAEAKRNDLFVDGRGLELTIALNEEEPLLAQAGSAKWAAADAALAKAVDPAKVINEAIQAKDTAAMAAIPSLLSAVQTELEAAQGALKEIPSDSLQAYQQEKADALKTIQKADLGIVSTPYALMGGFLILVFALFAWKLPAKTVHENQGDDGGMDVKGTLARLFHNKSYLYGVVAQTFYVGAQIMCWTFIVQYGMKTLGLSATTAQNCNILAMIIFVSSRFVCTFLMHYISSGALLTILASGAILLTTGTIFVEGYPGLYCLIGVSACMSLMFPTIYGIALDGLGDDAKLGSAGLILAIGGGCIMTPLQGRIIDLPAFDLGFMELASVRASFILPFICFIVIALYGWHTIVAHRKSAKA
jgi:fucose permease